MKNILHNYKQKLKAAGIESYNIDSMVLICAALNKTKEEIIFKAEEIEIDDGQLKIIDDFFTRRIGREPVSHIIGNREFYGLDFFVSEDVLDPRADSETLIDEVVGLATKKVPINLSLLEIGVGSGCLSIAILKHCQNISSATGLDISDKALAVCRRNIAAHDLNDKMKILKSDIFSALNNDDKFDIIVSNPPYIKTSDISNLQSEVKDFEPLLALDGGEDGLDFYRRIANESMDFLSKDGFIALEIGYDQKNDVIAVFSDHNFKLVTAKQDLYKNDRVLVFSRQYFNRTLTRDFLNIKTIP